MERNGRRWRRFLFWFLLITLITSIVFTLYRLIITPSVPDSTHLADNTKTKSDYVLMLTQCALGLVVMMLPSVAEKRFSVEVPALMTTCYHLFLYAAIYLGEIRSFYTEFKNWDVVLHTFSSFMLGCLSFSVITLLNKWDKMPFNLSPAFTALFALCFAVTLGVVWEIYEYTLDGLLKLNMQKFIAPDGTTLIGHAALGDTMGDLVVDSLGAFAASVMGYISLKYNKGWIEKLQIKKRKGK